MAYSITPLDTFDQFEATGAETRTFARFTVPEGSVVLCRSEIIIARTTDMVAKCITADVMIRRLVGDITVVIQVVPATANTLALSGDITTLSGATIAFFAAADEAGITVTTPAGMTIAWSSHFWGRIITGS